MNLQIKIMQKTFSKINIAIIIFVFTFMNVYFVHAQNISTMSSSTTVGNTELKNSIASEKSRLVQLKKGLNPSAGIVHTLKKGSSGSEVKILQQFLTVYGTFKEPSTSKYFGKITEDAVRKFQTKESIDPTGSVGPKTRTRIIELSSHAILQKQSATTSISSTSTEPTIVDAILSTDVGEDGSGISSQTTFASTTKNIYAILTLVNVKQDTEISFIRYFKNAYIDSSTTHVSRSGLRYAHFQWSLKSGETRVAGPYSIVFYINGVKTKIINFNIN